MPEINRAEHIIILLHLPPCHVMSLCNALKLNLILIGSTVQLVFSIVMNEF